MLLTIAAMTVRRTLTPEIVENHIHPVGDGCLDASS